MSFRMIQVWVCALGLLVGSSGPAFAQCTDCDSDGHEWPADCNDADDGVYPGASEICDGFDNDCNGVIDDDLSCSGQCLSLAKNEFDTLVSGDLALSQEPTVAWTGDGYGIAWRDDRNVTTDIYFALVSDAGVKMSADLRVTEDVAASIHPKLVWTGTEFGLAWVDERDGNREIYFTRLDAAGAQIGSDLRITSDGSVSEQPSLVWTGAEYALAWTDERDQAADSNREIYFARLDMTGVKIGSDVRLTSDTAISEQASLIWSGSEFGVAWTDERDANREIYFARISSSGVKVGTDLRVTSDAEVSAQPSLAWAGSEYGLAWTDQRNTNREIYFARVSSAGAKLGTDTRITNDSNVSEQASLDWTGEEYGVAWRDTRNVGGEIYIARIGAAGTKQGSDLRVSQDLGQVSRAPETAWTGLRHAVVWQDIEVSLARIDCSCGDADEDGVDACHDCDDNDSRCTFECIDDDGDTVYVCANDCDDADPDTYPQATQVCDGVNNDCDDASWPGLTATNEFDDDTDTFSECAGDCDDGDRDVYPAAPQICDGLNNDCNDAAWPALTGTNEIDDDGDTISECSGDCDDTEVAIYPGAPQICDGLNNDCNHASWPALTGTNETDNDTDTVTLCEGDCDDTEGAIYPGAPQICDGLNNDCNHASWPALTGTNEFDGDGDTFNECTSDCDDTEIAIYPGAPQICDGLNNDCNHASWPALTGTNEVDNDSDTITLCEGDCDDTQGSVYPAAPQICDGLNNDCNHASWPTVTGTNDGDDDGDTQSECSGDCDDTEGNVYPGAPQICDGLNNDCDDPAWPALTGTNEEDPDGDTYTECLGDCAPADGQNWAAPSEVRNLQLTYDDGTGVSTLTWQAPVEPGASSVLYDVIRSRNADDFDLGITCVAGDEPGLTDTDSVNLQVNTVAYYLVRAENDCPDGLGDVGTPTGGTPRIMRDCN